MKLAATLDGTEEHVLYWWGLQGLRAGVRAHGAAGGGDQQRGLPVAGQPLPHHQVSQTARVLHHMHAATRRRPIVGTRPCPRNRTGICAHERLQQDVRQVGCEVEACYMHMPGWASGHLRALFPLNNAQDLDHPAAVRPSGGVHDLGIPALTAPL